VAPLDTGVLLTGDSFSATFFGRHSPKRLAASVSRAHVYNLLESLGVERAG
jgi:hypothetical protein